MSSNGFIELLRLADRGIKRQKGTHFNQKTQWLGVAFSLGGYHLVAPLGDVAEVLSLPAYTSVPLSKPWLLGIANIRGRLLPITNLSNFLGLPPASSNYQSANQKILVIDQPKLFSGLQVDEILGIQTFSQRQYQPIEMPNDSPLAQYTHGQFEQNEQIWYVFMPSLLAQDTRYLEAAL